MLFFYWFSFYRFDFLALFNCIKEFLITHFFIIIFYLLKISCQFFLFHFIIM